MSDDDAPRTASPPAELGASPWPIHARNWELIGPPLRPSPADVAVVEAIAREPRAAPLRVLLLGVTPELATLAWSAGTKLVAVDRCEGMIGAVWPQSSAPVGAKAILGDWLALPFEDASVDLVLGDAVTTVLPYPRDTRALFAEVARVLSPGGRFVTRVFVPPSTREDLRTIGDDLHAGRVGTLSALKLRLLACLSGAHDRSVRLADAWTAWCAMAPDPGALASKLGWSPATFATIDVYKAAPMTTYAFADADELDAIARAAGLGDRAVHTPRYELGDRCPTIAWRKR